MTAGEKNNQTKELTTIKTFSVMSFKFQNPLSVMISYQILLEMWTSLLYFKMVDIANCTFVTEAYEHVCLYLGSEMLLSQCLVVCIIW